MKHFDTNYYKEDPSIAELTWFSIDNCICANICCNHASIFPPVGAALSLACLYKKQYFSNTSASKNDFKPLCDTL